VLPSRVLKADKQSRSVVDSPPAGQRGAFRKSYPSMVGLQGLNSHPFSGKGKTMSANNQNGDESNKPLPMKAITWTLGGVFLFLSLGYLIVPAFFDSNPFGGSMFEAGPAPWAMSEEEQKKLQLTESQAKGRHHFQQYCSSCHGPEGRGNGPSSPTLSKRPPNFIASTQKTKNGLNKAGVLITLEEGIPGSEMPAYKNLPVEVRNEIADFVEHLHTNPALF
jgi:mono/diheme cytochrome c family protein